MAIRKASLVVLCVFAASLLLPLTSTPLPQTTKATKPATTKKPHVKKPARKKAASPRVRRIRRAFVASADLKPMAMQLLENRSPQAYAAIEKYARAHAGTDAGGLAWLAVGYARFLDQDCVQAVDALKRAQPQAGELRDYVDYYLALCYLDRGQAVDAAAHLRGFEEAHRDSLLVREARLAYANALTASGQPQQAISLLQGHRSPTRAETELAMGKALAAAGKTAEAGEVLRKLYYAMPLSPEAAQARGVLDGIDASLPPAGYAEQKQRVDLLLQGRRFAPAAEEYRELLKIAPPAEQPQLKVALGYALWKSGRAKDGRKLLESVTEAPPEAGAQRTYALLEMERPDHKEVEKLLDSLRQAAPSSGWFMEGLLSAANMYLLEREYEKAARLYAEVDERFPGGKYAAYAHWKAAWLTYRLGRRDEAKYLFDQQIALYPNSPEVPNALYWRGRVAEAENDTPTARACYSKIVARFTNYYYADRARERLAAIKAEPAAVLPILDRIATPAPASVGGPLAPPAENLRAQKARLLENGGLIDLAIRELQAAGPSQAHWVLAEIARIYEGAGRHYRALQTLKRVLPSYYAWELEALPRPIWEALFPRPFWPDIERYSSENDLDPYLVASLIRQESEFNPDAVSRANAMGLMQLLPRVGRSVARQVKLRGYSTSLLTSPGVNIRLGTRYLRKVLDDHDGSLQYALAAYNAGNHRVAAWQDGAEYADIEEFVESIPFTETREYVQAILRNATMYRRLYGTDSASGLRAK